LRAWRFEVPPIIRIIDLIIGILLSQHVIPAKAGIYRRLRSVLWIPAFAGMTTWCLGTSADEPPKHKTLMAALGDSTTAGTPFAQSPLEAPPNGSGDPQGQYSYWMMHWRPKWEVLNYGIAGQTSIQIRARFDDIISRGPRYVIILAGVNDIYQGLPGRMTAGNLLWMYQRAQEHSIMPIAATVLPFDEATPAQAAAIEELNKWIKNASDKMRIPFADLNAAVRDPENPHRLSHSPDGIHPDIGGYRKMGLALIQAIDPIEKAWR
jgi:lysophospholipase L1-like esterase